VVTIPETRPDPAALETPPRVVSAPPPAPVTPAAAADAPVVADWPQRTPSFPRVLESTRSVDTIPGTQVYRAPEPAARNETAESTLPVGEATGSATTQ
jgi:hypothetical protein